VLDFVKVKDVRLLNIYFNESVSVPWLSFSGKVTDRVVVETRAPLKRKEIMRSGKEVRNDAIHLGNFKDIQ
jgi:hypothetical protein